MIRMTIYAGIALDDEDGPYTHETTSRMVCERDLSEEMRKLGLEWRQADYFSTRQTIIVLDPVADDEQVDVRARVREAASALERTGLL